jgi:hypothetical protein
LRDLCCSFSFYFGSTRAMWIYICFLHLDVSLSFYLVILELGAYNSEAP